ncbi:ABC transporter substrate-binding protein [Amorphus sp. 3PC139-8]|uniref:ABC transporter substrate-binding protein n=1 Tax=Amorphus sp. 3PC139-8 TaxID=2735676 RepID=UPI00345C8C22
MVRRLLLAPVLCLLGIATAAAQDLPPLKETPTLDRTNPNGLPPIAERIPEDPLIVDLPEEGRQTGRHGGDLVTLIGRTKDVRLINVWGYARLVGYTDDLDLVPDILSDVSVEDGASFTLHLRKGHKWSDGKPFTAEDFRYYWEEIINNEELTPSGPPPFMLVNGVPPIFEVIDDVTVRYTWPEPNPQFLPTLAQAAPPFIYRPAHYLKQFNPKFGDKNKIAKLVDEARVRNWAQLHNQMDEMYDATNPDLPSLQPWIPSKLGTDRRAIMVRNPYFYRIDSAGQQLPYIDRVVMNVSEGGLIAAKTQAGEPDLQARGLGFSDITVLKRGEESENYTTRLWPIAKANQIAIYPNLTTNDPVWRELFRDVRFRRALSYAIDREAINRVLFFGLATPSNNAILEASPLYKPEYQNAYADFDQEKADALLDEIGLTKRRADGVRLLSDGRPLELIIETAGESQEEVDALELIKDMWAEVGVGMFIRPSQRDILRNRAFSGDLMMLVWSGYDNGIPTPQMAPQQRVPLDTTFYTGPAWGGYVMSKGESGQKIDYEPVNELLQTYQEWLRATTDEEMAEKWSEILSIHAEQQLSIGTVAGVRQPVVVKNNLQNVPEKGVYGWDPGAQFGIYRMDEFFFDPPKE